MASSMRGRRLHVERTDADDVLRWVCHDERLTGGRLSEATVQHLPASGAQAARLSELVGSGGLAEVRAEGGDLLIRAHGWSRDLIETTTRAVRDDLDHGTIGWVEPLEMTADHATRVIEDTVGDVVDLHGGSVTVREVRHEGGTTQVVVELSGACDGCSGASETIYGRARDALRKIDPSVQVLTAEPVGLSRRRRGLLGAVSRRR